MTKIYNETLRLSENVSSDLDVVLDIKSGVRELKYAIAELIQKIDNYAFDSAERWTREKQTLDLIDKYINKNL